MKFRLVAVTTLLCCTGATLLGQDLAGTWQGTASGPGPARIVVKITRAADSKLEGQLFVIDQG